MCCSLLESSLVICGANCTTLRTEPSHGILSAINFCVGLQGDENSGNGPPPDEPVDKVMTALLFVFPAIGGLLFGTGLDKACIDSISHED